MFDRIKMNFSPAHISVPWSSKLGLKSLAWQIQKHFCRSPLSPLLFKVKHTCTVTQKGADQSLSHQSGQLGDQPLQLAIARTCCEL